MKQERFLKQDLLDRGWTPSLIKRFLDPPDAKPSRYGGGYLCVYYTNRVKNVEASKAWQEAIKRLKERRQIPPRPIDLLQAIFAVTRAAKRCRDAAQTCHFKQKHGLAGRFRTRKEKLYELKDRGIAVTVTAGRIEPVRLHGGFVEYNGEGYCFHSALLPKGTTLLSTPQPEPLRVEAKPRRTGEPKLKDAECTLQSLPAVPDLFERLRIPNMNRSKPQRLRDNNNVEQEEYDDNEYCVVD